MPNLWIAFPYCGPCEGIRLSSSFYVMGIAAIARDNYELLRELFLLRVSTNGRNPDKPVTAVLTTSAVLAREVQRHMPGRENQYTPLNKYLFDILREPLREFLPDDVLYDDLFDWFEYLLGLMHCDLACNPAEDRTARGAAFPAIRGSTGGILQF
jgi:hypothetical protein